MHSTNAMLRDSAIVPGRHSNADVVSAGVPQGAHRLSSVALPDVSSAAIGRSASWCRAPTSWSTGLIPSDAGRSAGRGRREQPRCCRERPDADTGRALRSESSLAGLLTCWQAIATTAPALDLVFSGAARRVVGMQAPVRAE
jgi:hypothetical protein